MAIRILTVGSVHIQYDDANYDSKDTVQNPEGYYTIKTKPGDALVLRVYADKVIYWHQPPQAASWVAIGSQMKVTLP